MGYEQRAVEGGLHPLERPPDGGKFTAAALLNPNPLHVFLSIFTRLSGRKPKPAVGLIRFVVVAVIIAIIGLVGLYFAIGRP